MFEWNSILTCDCGAVNSANTCLDWADVIVLSPWERLSVFSQLCSFNWRQAGEYVNEGWHSLLHDNSRSNSRLASQTILMVKFKLKSEASQATCGLFQFLQLLQVLQLLSRAATASAHFNEFTANVWKQSHLKIKCAECVLIKIQFHKRWLAE